jgi:subtilisin family serine protease
LAVGAKYGVAKGANAIAVKVMEKNHSVLSDLISGIEWSVREALKSNRPSIVNLSISGPPDDSLSMAASAGIRAGVHFTACAGNDYTDASFYFAGGSEWLH